jgi:hypothetical protein
VFPSFFSASLQDEEITFIFKYLASMKGKLKREQDGYTRFIYG